MMVNDSLLEQIIEGALMAAGQTLSVERIQGLFEEGLEPSKEQVLAVLERISEKCNNKGYELKKVATGYRFQVKQSVAKWVSRLWEEKPQRYSRALLETLSIIAYRQPVTRGEIEDIRGVAVSSHITKTLVEREWIHVVGHRDVPGRPSMYATTKMFLDYFNLESLDQLPTLEEIQEIADANHALELEDRVEEGNYDLSSNTESFEENENLLSAAADLAEAEAIVEQVEANVFKRPEDDEEQDTAEESQGIQEAEQQLMEMDEAIETSQQDEVSVEQDLSGLSEEEIAEATIARMIAEQEALLAKASVERGEEPEVAKESSAVSHETKDEPEVAESSADEGETPSSYEAGPSVFGDAYQDDEDELAAAMEEEMIAQLEAEQEALLEEAELESTNQDDSSPEAEESSKTFSDLANKFD